MLILAADDRSKTAPPTSLVFRVLYSNLDPILYLDTGEYQYLGEMSGFTMEYTTIPRRNSNFDEAPEKEQMKC